MRRSANFVSFLFMKKKIFFACLLIAIVVLCVVRWNTWFGNPPEPTYDVQHHPSRVLLTMGDDSESRYVTWQYDSLPHPCWLDYVRPGSSDTITLSSECEVYHSRSGVAAFHRAQIKNVNEEGVWCYRIRSEKDSTEWFCFIKNNNKDFSFLYFGDVQDDLDGGFDTLLPKVMAANSESSFLLFGGDLIERPMDQYWNVVFRSLDTFATRYPILAVAGNHEYLKGVTRTLERRFPLTFPYFLNTMEQNADNALYTFAKGDARFFFLDSNKDFWKLPKQREWLETELDKTAEKWKIVVLHHPLHSTKGTMNNLFQRYYFDDLVVKYKVDLVLQGHEHVYARSNMKLGNEYSPVRVVSYASQKDYIMEFKGDVDKWGTDDRYYQRISFVGDSLLFETFGADQGLYDRVTLVKNELGCRSIDAGKKFSERIRVSEWFKKNKSKKRVKGFEENIEKYLEIRNE